MNLREIPITSLIPQRPPFVMVDYVEHCDMVDAVTKFTIQPDNIFLDDGLLSPSGIIESIAQSCAARMGCINRMRNESIKIGYIGDIRNCAIHRQPRLGEELTIHVHILEDVFHLTLAEVTMRAGEEVLATALIKIALTDMEASELANG